MPLQKSHSAPHRLTSWSPAPPTVVAIPEESSKPQPSSLTSQPSAHFEVQDGFFHRSESYFSLSSMNEKKAHHWVHGGELDDVEREGHPQARTTASSPGTPGGPPSLPITPAVFQSEGNFDSQIHLILSPTREDFDADAILSSEIRKENHVGGLVSSAAKAVVAFPVASPSYDHEHLIHSYDHLHNTFSERRRSATAPDLTALRRDPASARRRKTNMYDRVDETSSKRSVRRDGPALVNTTLFSPVEEKVDYWGDEAEEQDGSWSAYLYESAKRLLIKDTSE
ncbi:hypothetical protein FRB96_005865 [Tulasnella sp. 330]|nr:hypothetical protein FRB96_005865 [Tulasnella sp. 330]KAG8884583.1 hypothetical protein FRB97_003880 [Tulasnella sp. 331]KAG8889565.1 hypothetical protein FRB98_003834 [Tulasnella sp. 332]